MSGEMIDAQRVAAEALLREARLLDRGDWDQWVAMYQDDAVFWVPAWLDEYDVTEDPATQVSLLYHDARRGLEERISRIESRKSITALPLPRTVHQVTNVEASSIAPDEISCESVFSVYVYDPRTAKGHSRHGRYQHTLKRHGAEWKIARKIITLANDNVATVLDFYSI
ncbi:aromatic-ring-hydroxylating dioxygenase subunit beta [Rhodopseudomonas sp. B29]|uniref:aromatic-ring-hydroxylating dioxygenase subunit beta n=1 Tax=Rhodopseudomonas sp. B29 TaxID=95607 RepID=UPI00034CF5D2|nr:aromatic-ring-hydroxylating dioxygenase subunit beta [Rhodopseudomonas sp. B29]